MVVEEGGEKSKLQALAIAQEEGVAVVAAAVVPLRR